MIVMEHSVDFIVIVIKLELQRFLCNQLINQNVININSNCVVKKVELKFKWENMLDIKNLNFRIFF